MRAAAPEYRAASAIAAALATKAGSGSLFRLRVMVLPSWSRIVTGYR
jgi:hypothetical protein